MKMKGQYNKELLDKVMSLHFAGRCREVFGDRCLVATRGMDVVPFRSRESLVKEAKNSTRRMALDALSDREGDQARRLSRKIEALFVTPSAVVWPAYPSGSRDVTYLILGW